MSYRLAVPRLRAIPHRRRGFGNLNYYDLLAQAHLQDCDPTDSACVSNNVAKQAAVEDFWASHQTTGVPDDTQLSFVPQTAAQVTEFYNPKPSATSNIVDTRGIMYVNSPDLTPPVQLGTPPRAAAPTTQQLAPGTPGGAAVISSSGTQQPASQQQQVAASSSFSFSSIPAWAWAVAAGAAFLMIGGAHGR